MCVLAAPLPSSPTPFCTNAFWQAALLAVDTIARDHAATYPDAFMRALPHAVSAASCISSAGIGAAGGALLLASTLISQLAMRLVPYLPHLVPALLEALEVALGIAPAPAGAAGVAATAGSRDSMPQKDGLALACTWLQTAGAALLATLPQFLRPYLARIMRAVMHVPSLSQLATLGEQTEAFSRALASAVPARLLLPSLVEALPTLSQASAAHCYVYFPLCDYATAFFYP